MSILRCLFVCFISLPCVQAAPHAERPNLVLIVTDDQGYRDVGFNGCTDIPTPNIDRIAHEGERFENGYVSYLLGDTSSLFVFRSPAAA